MIQKYTTGYVIQNYDETGKCVSQEFIASDEVSWENEEGESIDYPSDAEYFPMEMIQPNTIGKIKGRLTRKIDAIGSDKCQVNLE